MPISSDTNRARPRRIRGALLGRLDSCQYVMNKAFIYYERGTREKHNDKSIASKDTYMADRRSNIGRRDSLHFICQVSLDAGSQGWPRAICLH